MRSPLRRRASLGTAVAALGVGLTALSAHPVAAQTTVYSNTSTLTAAYTPGGATSATGSTLIVADDITPLAGYAGSLVTGFSFSVYNGNAAGTVAAAAPTIYFYDSSGASGGPGALLGAYIFAPIDPGAGGFVGVYNANNNPAGYFTLPTGTFWAGMSFSNGSNGTATAAQLNKFGQGLFSPPTVGSSQDKIFQSTSPGTVSNNPTGGVYNAPFGSSLTGNFGWSFSVAPAAVPEASTTVSLGLLLALGMGGLIVASKRKKANVQA